MHLSYYFLVSALPPMSFENPPSLNFKDFIEMCQDFLNERDFEKVYVLQQWIDICNLKSFWKNSKIDPKGSFASKEQLAQALNWGEGFPQLVFEFIDEHEGDLNQFLSHFNQLISSFIKKQIDSKNSFLRDLFSLEYALRLSLLGLRAKQFSRDLSIELQHEDPTHPIVAYLLAQKDSKSYESPIEDKEFQEILDQKLHEVKPWEFYLAIARYRFEKIESFKGDEVFSINTILGYGAQLILLEQIHELNEKQGHSIAENIIRNII